MMGEDLTPLILTGRALEMLGASFASQMSLEDNKRVDMLERLATETMEEYSHMGLSVADVVIMLSMLMTSCVTLAQNEADANEQSDTSG